MDSSQVFHNVALLPPPGFLGHLIPFLELAKKLVSSHDCIVTLIIPDDGTSMKFQRSLLQEIPSTITPIFLPSAPIDDLPENSSPEVLLPVRVIRSLPAIRDALSTAHASVLVVDLFAPYAIDVGRELKIPVFIFYVIAANELSLSMDFLGFRDVPEVIKLPGDVVVEEEDIPDSMKDMNSEVYKWMVDVSKKFLLADGILVNSFQQLESAAFKHLDTLPGIPPVYPVGPLIRTGIESGSNLEHECLKWLDDQPTNSVIFVSFGSGGALSLEQMEELAAGLEMSGQRFLWVVRMPRETSAAAYLKAGNDEERNPLQYLPRGFLERNKDRVLVVASWAPQIRVLSHESTGGFLTHCGWNSILEGAVHGVPMIAWPLCFEQRMNAVFLSDGLKGAIRVRENENGIVERERISCVVKELMEGEEGRRIRKTVNQLKIAAAEALSAYGSSTTALAKAFRINCGGVTSFPDPWSPTNSNMVSEPWLIRKRHHHPAFQPPSERSAAAHPRRCCNIPFLKPLPTSRRPSSRTARYLLSRFQISADSSPRPPDFSHAAYPYYLLQRLHQTDLSSGARRQLPAAPPQTCAACTASTTAAPIPAWSSNLRTAASTRCSLQMRCSAVLPCCPAPATIKFAGLNLQPRTSLASTVASAPLLASV